MFHVLAKHAGCLKIPLHSNLVPPVAVVHDNLTVGDCLRDTRRVFSFNHKCVVG